MQKSSAVSLLTSKIGKSLSFFKGLALILSQWGRQRSYPIPALRRVLFGGSGRAERSLPNLRQDQEGDGLADRFHLRGSEEEVGLRQRADSAAVIQLFHESATSPANEDATCRYRQPYLCESRLHPDGPSIRGLLRCSDLPSLSSSLGSCGVQQPALANVLMLHLGNKYDRQDRFGEAGWRRPWSKSIETLLRKNTT